MIDYTTLSREEIAWCAGVIDSIGLVRTRVTDAGSALAYVGVSTPNIEIAQQLATLTGTSVTQVKRNYNRTGCAAHCDKPHMHVKSYTVRWSLTGARALMFLSCIKPYLVVKSSVAEEVITKTSQAPNKPATTAKMRELGWVS